MSTLPSKAKAASFAAATANEISKNVGAASDILCVFVTKLRLLGYMDENSNSTVHACVLALKSVVADDDSFDLVEHQSHKDGLAHSQHGSPQRFTW